jgi:hypothetical protein
MRVREQYRQHGMETAVPVTVVRTTDLSIG